MNQERKISELVSELEGKIRKLEFKTNVLENILISNVPDWAEAPLNEVKEKGEVPYPFIKPNTFGSYDYYRIITLLVRNKVI